MPARAAQGPNDMATARQAAFRRGMAESAPFLLVIVPFGMVFGVVGTEAGFTLAQVMGFSVLVIAGASQIAAVQLMTEAAPLAAVVATALVINLRMAMYSAALAAAWPGASLGARAFAAYLMVDGAFALSARRHAERPEETVPLRLAFYFGAGAPTVVVWIVATLVGALFGARLPAEWGVEFAVPVVFIAVVAPILRTLPHVCAALSASMVALAASGLPYGGGLMAGAVAGVAVGTALEWAIAR